MGLRIGSAMSAGSMTVSGINKTNSTITKMFKFSKPKAKKKKRLSYNFKKISNQIMMSKTAVNAGKALTKARGNVIMLLMRKRSGEYDDKEIKSALEHAKDMERIAKKRKRHMEEEERLAQGGEPLFEEDYTENAAVENSDEEYDGELSAEELQDIVQELKELTQDSLEESLREMADELLSTVHADMSDEEIEELKRKHRAAELKEIMDADMKYLKALFERLQKERQQSANISNAVSLEIAGMDIPVPASTGESAAAVVESGAMAEGAAVDVSV